MVTSQPNEGRCRVHASTRCTPPPPCGGKKCDTMSTRLRESVGMGGHPTRKERGPSPLWEKALGSLVPQVLPGADRFLRGLRDAELEDSLGGNLDGLAGLRIAAHTLLA